DDGPRLSIADASVIEGTGGTTVMTFRVSVANGGNSDGTSPQDVSVNFATSDGSAHQPGDYTAIAGTLTIPAGSPSGTISVSVNGDTLDEVNETFLVTLSNPVDATIFDGQGVGTITDDDGPNISISDASVVEGNSGMRDLVFQVSLSAVSVQDVRLNFATA